jgi:hypothetical protein
VVRCVHRRQLRCERVLANRRQRVDDVACWGLGQLGAGLERVVGFGRGEPRGGGACRQSDRSSWGSVARTESLKDGAADIAGPQWYAACIGGSCAVSGCLRTAGNALMMLRVAGCGGFARGWSGWWGLGGASRGAVVHAVNYIGDDGAASLAPSLLRMAQLTSLYLPGTLQDRRQLL